MKNLPDILEKLETARALHLQDAERRRKLQELRIEPGKSAPEYVRDNLKFIGKYESLANSSYEYYRQNLALKREIVAKDELIYLLEFAMLELINRPGAVLHARSVQGKPEHISATIFLVLMRLYKDSEPDLYDLINQFSNIFQHGNISRESTNRP